ncbi:glycosyltransferase [Paracoccus aerodenitrificans]|uniref:glycosyltransferase n=1 Tax=Paracoccus aerodenitrificans TaxID=3017781 RepID=UPI0022F07A1D|nr:glycosyltransferase [Paracoccus aerodenitrificans]WBU63264.1 glycosyltransferase [Paracoccus aerodenitrificans]
MMLQKISAAVPELEIENNLFGSHLSDRLRETDIVLNLHAAQDGLLETARISEALAHGCLVVSEESLDQDQLEADRRLIFAPQDDPAALTATLRGLLDDPDKYRRHQLGGNRPQPDLFRNGILRGLQGLRIISPDVFEQLSDDYPQPTQAQKGELSRICLTLPETTARTRAFDAQSDSSFFQLWPGMKATPGWRGAALSYRHIMRKLRSAEVTEALVVEDDVLLPADFERRLLSIRRYMDECDADLFSGMIVDLHKDARVLDVKRRDGMCIVQLDRAVTMICNLYRRRMIDYLAQWNDRDDNAFTNTIDRYMEQATHLKVITTLPFMVDYRSETPSTLRKSDNSAFDALRAKSEKMLAERVSEFELSASLL